MGAYERYDFNKKESQPYFNKYYSIINIQFIYSNRPVVQYAGFDYNKYDVQGEPVVTHFNVH